MSLADPSPSPITQLVGECLPGGDLSPDFSVTVLRVLGMSVGSVTNDLTMIHVSVSAVMSDHWVRYTDPPLSHRMCKTLHCPIVVAVPHFDVVYF